MYITKVSGHRQATLAIQRSLKELDPNIEAPTVNGFGYTYPILEKVVNRAYMSVIKTTPKVWDYLYDNPKVVKNSMSIKNFLHKTSHAKIEKLFQKYDPDTIVCTQAFPCGMVADYKREKGLNFKLVGVLTDYAPHAYWINEGVDYYIVPSEEARERLIMKGAPAESVRVYGIPIRPKFAAQLDKEAIARGLGLDLSLPIILIMGGGQGLGPIKDVVRALIKMPEHLQMVVLTGTNKKLIKWLERKEQQTEKKILFYEYANNVDELMEISTMIVTKPGGMTTSESLTKGLPMVIVNPIPGQETRNADFLLKAGIAIRIDKTDDIGEEIELLLKSPERLAAMRKAAYENSRPYAALDIARLILGQNAQHPLDQKFFSSTQQNVLNKYFDEDEDVPLSRGLS
ncbi:MAG: glycosyltransferase [Candidatus Omnitrophica bacterium]|nr:glycosyltransferase [Candidatus Omnitrophota bacterium]